MPSPPLALAVLSGCFDPNDCRMVDPAMCEEYRPQGLACGLAHRADLDEDGLPDNFGGSCQLAWDPATSRPTAAEGKTVSAHPGNPACPDGHTPLGTSDGESSDVWMTCASEGNDDRSSRDPSEVPAGSACGLGLVGLERSCAGETLTGLECPDGFHFRWVPDTFSDRVDAGCDHTTTETASVFGMARIVGFCELAPDRGCTEDCPPARGGDLCGLHARTGAPRSAAIEDYPLDDLLSYTTPDNCGLVYDGVADPESVEALRRAAEIVPSCRGVPVEDDDGQPQCPTGLDFVCTVGFVGETVKNYMALCWCDLPESAQAL